MIYITIYYRVYHNLVIIKIITYDNYALYRSDIHNYIHNLAAPQGTKHGTPDSAPILGTTTSHNTAFTVTDHAKTTFPLAPILSTTPAMETGPTPLIYEPYEEDGEELRCVDGQGEGGPVGQPPGQPREAAHGPSQEHHHGRVGHYGPVLTRNVLLRYEQNGCLIF